MKNSTTNAGYKKVVNGRNIIRTLQKSNKNVAAVSYHSINRCSRESNKLYDVEFTRHTKPNFGPKIQILRAYVQKQPRRGTACRNLGSMGYWHKNQGFRHKIRDRTGNREYKKIPKIGDAATKTT